MIQDRRKTGAMRLHVVENGEDYSAHDVLLIGSDEPAEVVEAVVRLCYNFRARFVASMPLDQVTWARRDDGSPNFMDLVWLVSDRDFRFMDEDDIQDNLQRLPGPPDVAAKAMAIVRKALLGRAT